MRSRPSIILHVGTEKTGSTSVQKTLFDNAQALKLQGMLVPQTLGHPCHYHLTTCALGAYPEHPLRRVLNLTDQQDFEIFKGKTLQAFNSEVQASKCQHILISDEHISAHLTWPDMMGSFAEILSQIAPVSKVIIYIRRQDKYRLSLFSEAIKAGNLETFDHDNPLARFESIPRRFDYLNVLDLLSRNFGRDKLVTRLFRKDELKDGNTVSDYMQISDVDTLNLTLSHEASNPSLNSIVLLPLAKITKNLISEDDQILKETVSHIVKQTQKYMPGQGAKMHPDAHRAFLTRFEQMNKTIKDIYFPDRQSPIFSDIEEDPDLDEKSLYPNCSLTISEFTKELSLRQATAKL